MLFKLETLGNKRTAIQSVVEVYSPINIWEKVHEQGFKGSRTYIQWLIPIFVFF